MLLCEYERFMLLAELRIRRSGTSHNILIGSTLAIFLYDNRLGQSNLSRDYQQIADCITLTNLRIHIHSIFYNYIDLAILTQ